MLKIHDGYQRRLASIVYKYFDKKTSAGGIKNEKTSNKELAEELRKPILRKFNKQKVHSSFISNFWGANLADIQLLNKLNKGVRFSWWIMDIYNKYTFVISLKDRKGIKVTNAFQRVLEESNQVKYG